MSSADHWREPVADSAGEMRPMRPMRPITFLVAALIAAGLAAYGVLTAGPIKAAHAPPPAQNHPRAPMGVSWRPPSSPGG